MFFITSSFYNFAKDGIFSFILNLVFENTEFEKASGQTETKSLLQLYLEERHQIEKKIRNVEGRRSLFR
jgi:hypothetical protein